jgi:hypothetical protein
LVPERQHASVKDRLLKGKKIQNWKKLIFSCVLRCFLNKNKHYFHSINNNMLVKLIQSKI